jgi:phospholipase C
MMVAQKPDADAQPRTAPAAAQQPSRTAAQPCRGPSTQPVRYRHVIWIWMENHSYGQVIGSAHAPFENSLARACGLATQYRAVTHPSLPNYLAAVGGSTFGVTRDQPPSRRAINAPTIFSEVSRSGRQWRTYSESMPGNCRPLASAKFGGYARNPAAYFTSTRRLCDRWDVPMGNVHQGNLATALDNSRLPAFSLMIPNLCHSTHACPVATGDTWLSRWITRITTSASYQGGSTAIFLTWDEGKHDTGQHVPLIVVSPTTTPGTTSSTVLDHYSLLRTTAELLGVAPPGHSGATPSMLTAFGL